MFSLVKSSVDMEQILSTEMNLALTKVGDANLEFEDKVCPFCGHRDCFRVKINGADSFYHCFSCEAHGDVIGFIAAVRKISPKDAALAIAKENGIEIPSNYSPMQEIFTLTAGYYHQAFLSDTSVYAELVGKTPLAYQMEVRRHKQETLEHFQVGWSDGKLITYLEGIGFERELLEQTGLVGKKGTDFLPNKAFIYPHYVNGKVSHFTFKDPLKVREYQLKNANRLNGCKFYNQDSASASTVAIVEGENDLLSLYESGWEHGVIATIGQISASQIEWVDHNLKGKDVVTFFDSDSAGDKYRVKLHQSRLHFKSLKQVCITTGPKDIDEYLTQGGDLAALLDVSAPVASPTPQPAATSVPEASAGLDGTDGDGEDDEYLGDIVEREKCYYKIHTDKDGGQKFKKLTNFVIELRNVFIRGDAREREIIIVRSDGIRSSPVMVDSECKVSLRNFKVLLANAVDASFYGSENDLTEFWEFVYKKNAKKERTVHIPGYIGKMEQFGGGWLFRNMFITSTGAVLKPDEEGIIWFDGGTTGVKPAPIDVGENGKFAIPALNCDLKYEEREAVLKMFLEQLALNLGDPNLAIVLVAWAKANVYSDEFFEAVQGFPFLFIWGRHGQGKTVIGKWIAALFDMEDSGYMTISQLKSGVGWGRKQAYYSCLPLIMDEIRVDRTAINDLYPNVRSWYQRASRPLGTKEGMNIRVVPVRSTTMFLGQDEFTDSATKQRTINTRVPKTGREMVETYKRVMSEKDKLSSIGYHWIVEATQRDKKPLIAKWRELDLELVDNGCESRSAKNWAIIGTFGLELAEKYFPDLDFKKYLLETTKADSQNQNRDDTIYRFFTDLEGLWLQERSGFLSDHLKREGNTLYIWFRDVFRIVRDNQKAGVLAEERFSENAVKAALKDEKWCIREDREPMGPTKTRRRVVVIDLTTAPETIQNIASGL